MPAPWDALSIISPPPSSPTLLLKPMFICGASPLAACSSDAGPVIKSSPLVSFLVTLQQTAFQIFSTDEFGDPKTYVDLSLKTKYDLDEAKQALTRLLKSGNGSVSAQELAGYIKNYFNNEGDELVPFVPREYSPEPVGFLPGVENETVKRWALEVHSLWANLSRRVSDDAVKNHQNHTLLPLPATMVIPGSRFREVYYWDSYWAIRGLLVSKMYETAKGIVANLISLLDEFDHVLNGARAYYTNRSQPPLLSAMIRVIYKYTDDIDFIQKALPALLKEHHFWTSGFHKVTVVDQQGFHHTLSRYCAMWDEPRPESATIDKELASNISSDCERRHLFREVASTAESGMDFSTRWMRNHSDMTSLATTLVLPVDLNSFIMGMELDIAFLANATGNHTTENQFLEKSEARKKAINAVFWNKDKKQWLDYWLNDSTKGQMGPERWNAMNQNQNVYASNFIPLWMEPFHRDDSLVKEVMEGLKSSDLIRPAGIATSLINSSLQWDGNNGWPPIQHMIIRGLARSNLSDAKSLAREIAMRWIKTNYAVFKKTGAMYEKYNVDVCGETGSGGEYTNQIGFAWSNGVVLALLEAYGWPNDTVIDCEPAT